MKKNLNLIILILASNLVLCQESSGQESSHQESSYRGIMLQTLEKLNGASGQEHYLECAGQFERIATAEKTRWLPYYYGAYALTLMSFDETDGAKKDLLLDRAQEMVDRAMEIAPGESEIHTLQAFMYPSRIMVDPMQRGGVYMEKTFRTLEQAKSLNPDNPRIYFLEAINKLNMPPSMGGGPEVARPLFEKAAGLFRAFHHEDPLWPRWGEEANRAELEKLTEN
jgi:hypothetical protein